MPHAAQLHMTDEDLGSLILIADGASESIELVNLETVDSLYHRGLVNYDCSANPPVSLTTAGQALLPETFRNQSC